MELFANSTGVILGWLHVWDPLDSIVDIEHTQREHTQRLPKGVAGPTVLAPSVRDQGL